MITEYPIDREDFQSLSGSKPEVARFVGAVHF